MQTMFEHADKDKSGSLNINEIRLMLKGLDEDFPEAEIIKIMKGMDVDNNGRVSLEEFERVMSIGTR